MAIAWRDDYKKWALEKIKVINSYGNYTLFGKVREEQIKLSLPVLKKNNGSQYFPKLEDDIKTKTFG